MSKAFFAAAQKLKGTDGGNQDSSSQQQTMTIQSNISSKIECPFNLDEIFQADLDRFQHLKDVIKFIIDNLERTTSKVQEMEMKMVQKYMQIDR